MMQEIKLYFPINENKVENSDLATPQLASYRLKQGIYTQETLAELTVRMEHSRNKTHSWWLIWIILCKLKCQFERTWQTQDISMYKWNIYINNIKKETDKHIKLQSIVNKLEKIY